MTHQKWRVVQHYTSAKGIRTIQGKSGEWKQAVSHDEFEKRKTTGLQRINKGKRINRTIKSPIPGTFTYGDPIRVSVGAKVVGGFELYNPLTGERIKLVPGGKPIYPRKHLLAGKGSKKKIRIIDYLLQFGGTEKDWKHEKAYLEAYDEYGYEAYIEVHWFECEGISEKFEQAVRARDDEVFFYDIEEWESRWKW